MEPLASKLRPNDLKEFVGQKHIVGKDKPLAVAIKQKHLFSFILWGPPGVGKTTLAKIYARSLKADLHELSAVSAGKADIKKIVEHTKDSFLSCPRSDLGQLGQGEQDDLGRAKILFLDEIHRFNKTQQDFLLPYVESGVLTLIGATTENPSFEVIPALLSRMRVFVLDKLSDNEMMTIIKRTGFILDKEAHDWLVAMADGDARQVITILENTSKLYGKITIKTLKETLQSKFLRYDKKGDEHHNTISAFIKSMRSSQPDAALYYLARMLDAGEDPKFIARRMVVFASEDIGISQPTALVVANEVFRAVETVGFPECDLNLAHGAVYLANAPKDRRVYNALRAVQADVKETGNLPIPMNLRNAPTKLMKDLGYSKDYEQYTEESLLPEKLKNKKYLKEK
ncbi:MAG: replication-associated recombination protein A [Candidatus Pacebacteria bacterium]|nr:replication-associated recombination protein A [Candidatus Paceibacterota bacterium]